MTEQNIPPIFDPAWIEFDKLTDIMSEASLYISEAPNPHAPLHEAVLLNSYGKAYELLKEHPEFVEIFRRLGDVVIASSQTYVEASSLRQLRSNVGDTLLTAQNLKDFAPDIALALQLDTDEIESFEILFGDIIPLKVELEPDEVVEETDDQSGDINILDVLELMEMYDLTAAEMAIIKQSLETIPVNIADLRLHEWDVMTLPKSEYDQLVQDFPTLRSKALSILNDAEIPARWLENRRGAKVSYQLLLGEEAQAQMLKKQQALETHGHKFEVFKRERYVSQRRKERTEAAEKAAEVVQISPDVFSFTTQLIDFAAEYLNSSDGEVKSSALARAFSDELGIPRYEAAELVRCFIVSEDIFYSGSSGGTRLISLTRPLEKVRPARKNGAKKLEGIYEQVGFSEEEVTTITSVFDILGSLDILRGETLQGLRRATGRVYERKEAEFNRLIRRVESYGYLKLEANRARAGRARKGTMVTFKDQALKDRWKNERTEIVNELREIKNSKQIEQNTNDIN